MKILFISKTAGKTEYKLFEKLAMWITQYTENEAYICHGGNDSPIVDPDVVVHLHGHSTPAGLTEMGITSNPKKICYMLGQSKPNGWAVWGNEIDEFNDEIWCYGRMNQQSRSIHTFKFAPLPIDITEVPYSSKELQTEISICRMAETSNMVGRMWHDNTFTKNLCTQTLISNMTRENALMALSAHNVFIGNFNYGNLGKSELEAMASGMCCLGYLSTDQMEMIKRLGKDFPFVNVTKETFNSTLKELTIENVIETGNNSRLWMVNNYSNERIANFWSNLLSV